MNKQTQQNDEQPTIYKSMPARRDQTSAEIVEKGIALQALCGTKAAAEFLRFKMIAIDVVIRVLSRHAERRDYAGRIHPDPVLAERAFRQKKSNDGHPPKAIALATDWRH
jgi:hypothetical protein